MPVEVRDDNLRINPVGALKNNFKLRPESLSDSDVITLQEKSSQNKAFDPSSSSEPWSAKTQNVEIPESSTERDLVLLNEDSVYHPQSSSPDVTTTTEGKPSTEHVEETRENSEEKNKSFEEKKLESLEEDPDKLLLDLLQVEAAIKDLGIENKMISEPIETPVIVTEAPKIVEPETEKVVEETSSEIPQMPILVSEIDNNSRIDDLEKELEQEIEKMLDDSQEDNELSLPSFIQILHNLDRTEAKAKEIVSTTEIVPSYVKKYHFQFSVGPETGIQESDHNENSQEMSNQPPFFIHVFFNVSDGDVSSADRILKSEESVLDPISSFIDPGFSGESKSEDTSLDEETLKWWVNIPELQETKVGDLSDEDYRMESEAESEESAAKHFLDLFFSQPDSESVIPESDKVEDKSNEDVEIDSMESNDENIKKIFPDELVPQESASVLSEGVPSSEELQKEMEDFLKALANVKISDEDHEIAGTQTESHLYQKESMAVEEETVSEEIPEITENELDWKNAESLFHSQPTWKEDSDTYLKDLFQNFEPEIDEYDESSNFDSKEYMYE